MLSFPNINKKKTKKKKPSFEFFYYFGFVFFIFSSKQFFYCMVKSLRLNKCKVKKKRLCCTNLPGGVGLFVNLKESVLMWRNLTLSQPICRQNQSAALIYFLWERHELIFPSVCPIIKILSKDIMLLAYHNS